MSIRRKIGDRVFVAAGAGFNASRGEWGLIADTEANRDEERMPCPLACGDNDCRDWPDVWLDSGRPAYHVSECEMEEPAQLPSGDSGEPADLAEIIDDLKWAQEYLEQARQKIERWEQLRIQPELGVNPEAQIKSEGIVTEVTDRPDMVIGEE